MMMKPTVHIAVAVVIRAKYWLVARRLVGAHLGGTWEFPGGKQRRGESVVQAAVRELREECGIAVDVLGELPVVRWEYAERVVHITPVLCRWRCGAARPRASDACRWVTAAELQRLDMPAANAGIITAALRAAGQAGEATSPPPASC